MEAAYDLMYQPQPSTSAEWFEVAERLRWTTWRVASAIHCLSEWMEPDDETPDVDEDPGPSPGRRAISTVKGLRSEPARIHPARQRQIAC